MCKIKKLQAKQLTETVELNMWMTGDISNGGLRKGTLKAK